MITAWSDASPTTELFFYPAPRIYPNGDIELSPITTTIDQITTAFPTIAEMSGIVAMFGWSDLSPSPGRLDLAPLRKVLDFWQARARAVVIGVATVGYPMLRDDRARKLASSTPDWVLSRCATYRQGVRVLGPARTTYPYPRDAETILPVYWDASFQGQVAAMVRELARLDGHPALSKVRIALGIETEDNPTFDGLRAAMPGWSNRAWIAYCRSLSDLYLDAFRRTQLEFDVDRLGFIASIGTAQDRAAAASLLDHLRRNGVFLAMDGLDPQNARSWLSGDDDGTSRSIDDLVNWRARGGCGIGLETTVFAGLPTADIQPIAELLARVRPDRLVFNFDVAAALAPTADVASASLFDQASLDQGRRDFHQAVRGLRLSRHG